MRSGAFAGNCLTRAVGHAGSAAVSVFARVFRSVETLVIPGASQTLAVGFAKDRGGHGIAGAGRRETIAGGTATACAHSRAGGSALVAMSRLVQIVKK